LVPDLPGINKDIFVEIKSVGLDNYFYYFLDGSMFKWERFHEEFAGDDYYKGPEARIILQEGEYGHKGV